MSSLLPVQTVAVAVDGVGVLVRSMRPDDNMATITVGALSHFRGRLAPGDHDVRVFVLVRPAADAPSAPDVPLPVVHNESCITVRDGVPLTATAILYDNERNTMARPRVRFDIR